jgi:hypothetical protein
MKGIYAGLPALVSGRVYGQIIEGVAKQAFRQRFPSTALLATTRTWQERSDPYREG